MSDTKFYRYNGFFENASGDQVEPLSILDDEIFQEQLELITETDTKAYFVEFRELGSNEFQGVILRSKTSDGFFAITEETRFGSLSSELEEELLAGDINFDYTDFVVRVSDSRLEFLLERGFQTPGMGVLQDYIEEHVNDGEIAYDYKHELRDISDEKIQDLLDSELASAEVSFKKQPRTVQDGTFEEGASSMLSDDYRLRFEVSLRPGDRDKDDTKPFLERVASMIDPSVDTFEESFRTIDFAKHMHSFKVEGTHDGEVIEENFTDLMKKEIIETEDYGLHDRNLGERLIVLL